VCLILFAWQAHPVYRLIVAANRDEYYARPAREAHYWEDAPQVYAGRDLEKMGTWLGVSRTGRFAALTNYRAPGETRAGRRSRGELPAEFLTGHEPPDAYLQKVSARGADYPGFNLLAGDLHSLCYYSNREGHIRRLAPGVYGLSNDLLNTDWPKVKRGREELSRIVSEGGPDLGERLLRLLRSDEKAPDHMLPSTGVPLALERMLSSIFIESEGYGTRCSTVVLMSGSETHFIERTYSRHGFIDREQRILHG
jgi:uncharacterized protein with NRDE domain